jgi:hypothetical protein
LRDRKLARRSLGEEHEAVAAYSERIPNASPELKQVLKHNLSEEREHAAALKPFAGRVPYKHSRAG